MSDKLDLQSPDFVRENVEKIAALFPNCVTESAEGKVVDFDMLRQELSGDIVEGSKERYRLEWPGKREAIVTANIPTTNTLRPVREDSVNFDSTENLYIEGDNLEVLKLLQESYLGKIKMIYIDPPYNTGKDFVYRDNFTQDAESYKEESGQVDEFNRRLMVNPDTSGRYHSDWLTMMYPRLKLARNLLSDDGVIFISIDDNEVHNLRKICDEIFGDHNLITCFVWKTDGNFDNQARVKKAHEYILLYAKNEKRIPHPPVIDPSIPKSSKLYKDTVANTIIKNGIKNPPSNLELPVGFPANIDKSIINKKDVTWPKYDSDVIIENNKTKNKVVALSGWSSKALVEEFISNDFRPILDSKGQKTSFYITKTGAIEAEKQRTENQSYVTSIIKSVGTTQSTSAKLKENGIVFSFPKPVNLLIYLLQMNVGNDFFVLDFFSGSSSSADAVMKLNSIDIGKRKFIQVQLRENVLSDSEAYKAGYNNICEIGKERIRRAGKAIVDEQLSLIYDKKVKLEKLISRKLSMTDGQWVIPEEVLVDETAEKLLQEMNELQTSLDRLDTGFRVYRLDSSNMKEVYYKPEEYRQDELDLFADNYKTDRTPDDLLAQVMLDWGLPLSLKIEKTSVQGKEVFKVAGNSLFACFDTGVDEAFAKAIAPEAPLRIVFRDSSFADDTAKTNVKQLLKQLSPETEMKVV